MVPSCPCDGARHGALAGAVMVKKRVVGALVVGGLVACGGRTIADPLSSSGAGGTATSSLPPDAISETGGGPFDWGGAGPGGGTLSASGGFPLGAGGFVAVTGGRPAAPFGGSSQATGGWLVTGGAPIGLGAAGSGSPPTGGLASGGAEPGTQPRGGSPPRDCGPLIDDMEDATGWICSDGIRHGPWYSFNDEGAEQWPPLSTPGVPIPSDVIPGGRQQSLRAMHTFGGPFSEWGAGIGVDLFYDGATYGTIDASAYDGITFWVRGTQEHHLQLRISDEHTTHVDYGGTCTSEPCVRRERDIGYDAEWTQVWAPFTSPNLHGIDTARLTNIQFFVPHHSPFDFWIDDLSFYTGEPACCPSRPPECQGELPIEDPVLFASLGEPGCMDTCIETTLSIRPDSTHSEPVTSLTGLACYAALANLRLVDQALTEVDELAKMPWLSVLELPGNQLRSIEPLGELDYLHVLDISRNQIGSLTPLSRVRGLRVLRAASNLLTSSSGLESHAALEELHLSNNQLAEIDSLPPSPLLRQLNLADNRISGIGALASSSLLRDVDLSNNQLTDVSPLASATECLTLNLDGNPIRTLDPLSVLLQLRRLTVANAELTSLAPLQALTSLLELDASTNRLTATTGLGGSAGLSELNLADNAIGDIADLPAFRSLVLLDLSNNRIEDIESLRRATYISQIVLSHNAISDLSPLTEVTTSRIDASYNQIEQVPQLDALGVSRLNLEGNLLSELAPFSADWEWEMLSFANNPIRDLEPLASMGWFYELDLSGTEIFSLRPLVDNPNIRSRSATYAGTRSPSLFIEDTPDLDCELEAANIAALRARGIRVFTDCDDVSQRDR